MIFYEHGPPLLGRGPRTRGGHVHRNSADRVYGKETMDAGQCLFFGFSKPSNFLGPKNKMMILVGFAVF